LWWTVQYTILEVNVPPGGASDTLYVGFTAKVPIYDCSLTAVPSGASFVIQNNVWTIINAQNHELLPNILQQHNFRITIPNTAQPGNQYYINLLIQGYNDTAKVNLTIFGHQFLYWRYQGSNPFAAEIPEYTQDTTGTQDTIQINVTD
jgi:hypothetical protein